MSKFKVSRRKFIGGSVVAGGGLIVGVNLLGEDANPVVAEPGGFVANAFIQVTPDNVIRFYCPRDEMGQGVTTGLATLVGEELDVDPDSLQIEFVGADAAYSNPALGVQGTGGSTSMMAHFIPLRQAAANCRSVLVEAAAIDLGIPHSRISTDNGYIVVNNQRHPYGDFVATARNLTVPESAPLKDSAEFKYIGAETPRIDSIEKATGTAVFGIDVEIPNMHFAVVKRSPVPRGTLASYDASAVRAMPGVTDVVEIDAGIAIVAEKYWQAKSALEKLETSWVNPELENYDSDMIKADFERAMDEEEGLSTAEQGDVESAFEQAEGIVDSRYWAPYLAHTPMEPMNAVVRIENGKGEVWSGTQGPVGAEGLVARYAGLSKDDVTVHTTYLGGGFGRRGTLTHITEATQIAVAANKPIKLVWSREDDIKHGVYRPSSLMNMRASVDSNGKITALEAKRVGGNIMPDTVGVMLPALLPTLVPQSPMNIAEGAARSLFKNIMVDHGSIEGLYEDYDLPNRVVRHVTVDHGVPLTFWRSVGHSYTGFAIESFIDELAERSGMDPIEFRLKNTENNPRLAGVIQVAGDRMREMQANLPAGHYLGFAAHSSFLSYVAEVAEVSIVDNEIRVHNVVCAVDCGIAVNPDVVRAQMEGGIMYGLTAALHGEIGVENGMIKQSNFNDYPILRMHEAPEVEVIIVDSSESPTGVGEPGLPPIAPAVANAVYAATGKRLRSLPLKLA